MIVNSPVYGDNINLRCAVEVLPDTWIEILGTSTMLQSQRGGSVGVAGIASVDVGTMSINVLDALDPATVAVLAPNQSIVVYVDDAEVFPDTLVDGAVFTGTIQDISTDYFYEKGEQHINVVIYAVDAVSTHAGITVTNEDGTGGFTGTTFNGVADTANGYQRWEDRINDLSTEFAKTAVPTVIISAPIPIYTI
jgi:hypothetical protein